ncbi:MAG: cyclase family protein [Luteitalea sp.]|nr:cyclase family protein [Luteitalea sp.]
MVAVACRPQADRGGPPSSSDEPRRSSQPSETSGASTQTLLQLLTDESIRLVDLTHALSPQSLYWPTGSPFEHRRLAWGVNEAGFWYAAAEFSSPEHLGTHLDAPIHFAERGWTTTDIPVERFVAPAAVVDISKRPATNPDATLQPSDVTTWERANGALMRGSILIVRTGWSERWPDWERYYGSKTPKDPATLHFPGVSREAAAMLVERDVSGVGIDTASIDPGRSTTFDTHRVLAAANIFNLENLVNLEELPPLGAVVVALPMKIEGGTGGPTRVLAIVPR